MPFHRHSRLPLLLMLVAALAIGLAACGGDDDEADAPVTVDGPSGSIVCSTEAPDEPADPQTYDAAGDVGIDPGTTYTATLATSCGDIVVELDPGLAPNATNNFVFLAEEGFYDGLTFHRVVPGFVVQGGDPSGDGTGGPGYQFEDELPDDGYSQGSLAMANAGPNTNGSQFFIVTGDASALGNNFTRFGRVTEGLDVAQAIEGLADPSAPPGDPASQQPTQTVYINSVTIDES
ncbi:MAG: peptidylprolyl isomerase [Miltoncostaeaceae bacterium]